LREGETRSCGAQLRWENADGAQFAVRENADGAPLGECGRRAVERVTPLGLRFPLPSRERVARNERSEFLAG
jgi:hypothetical protein